MEVASTVPINTYDGASVRLCSDAQRLAPFDRTFSPARSCLLLNGRSVFRRQGCIGRPWKLAQYWMVWATLIPLRGDTEPRRISNSSLSR